MDGRTRCIRERQPFPAGLDRRPNLCARPGEQRLYLPGRRLGRALCEAARITDAMFLTAARTLACQVGAKDLALGRVYPALSEIREVSVQIAAAVAGEAIARPGPAAAPGGHRGRHPRTHVQTGLSQLRLSRDHAVGARLAHDVEDIKWCVGPAPFRQAQGPERVEGLAAGPQPIGEMARRSSVAKPMEDRPSGGPTFN